MDMIRKIAAILLAAALCLGAALAEEPAAASFATIGEAMASEGFTGVAGSDEEHYVVAVEKDGAYIRLVADLDDEARRLGEEIVKYEDAEKLEAAFSAYNEYVLTLPVAYEEEITAAPLTGEELDAWQAKPCRNWRKRAMSTAPPIWAKTMRRPTWSTPACMNTTCC